MKIRLLFVALLSATIFNTYAEAAQSHQAELSYFDQKNYWLTFESCRLFSNINNPLKALQFVLNPQSVDVMMSTLGDANLTAQKFLAGEDEALRVFRHNRGLGAYVNQLLQSDGFRLALLDCFPSDEKKQKAYVVSLLFFDAAAKYAIVGGMTHGTLRYLKWTKTYFSSPWVKTLFLGSVATMLTRSTHENEKSLYKMMSDQYQNLSIQIETLIQKKKSSDSNQ